MKTILQTVAFAFVLCCAASAQTTITLNNAHSGGTVEACEGIVLSPGFQFTANAGSSLNLQINLDVCADATMPLNLSANKNYIVSYTPQVACTDVSQIANSGFKGVEVVYYDGLGRPEQQVAPMATPSYRDIVTPITYDPYGRQDKDYLPYAATTGSGAYQSTGLTTQQAWYGSAYPGEGSYASARRRYEASPLNRVEQEYLPGGGAYATTATTDHTYTANAQGEVKLWKVTGGTLSQAGTYAAGKLYVHQISDPDSRITRTYTDMQGRTVETRQLSGAETLITSYAYDAWGRLAVVIPPKAQGLTVNGTEFNRLVYRYTYDGRGRCIEKKLPDSEPVYYVYDKADRLIMSQDGNQRAANEWSVTKYDRLGRPAIAGYITAATSRSQLQQQYGNTVVTVTGGTSGGTYGYTQAGGPTLANANVLTVSYYDYSTYLSSTDAQLAHQPQNGYGTPYENFTGQLVGTLVKRLDDNTKLVKETVYYDEKRNPIQTRSISETGGLTVAHTAYTFTGQPARSEAQHRLIGTTTTPTTEKYEYEYDHAGRITELKHGVDATPTTLATYSYDELGRQQQKVLRNGDATVETIASSYDIQGRLTALQGSKFSQQLYYHTAGVTGSTPQYGGNISAVKWQHGPAAAQTYRYGYDGFSRLTSAVHSGGNSESQTYDANGNMLSITRAGAQAASLSISYTGNQIAAAGGASYAYDSSGNMRADGQRGMSITYNRLNLPQTVSKGSDVLAYGYSADGQKREKKYNNTVTQHYRGSIVYDGSETPEYVATPEGMVRKAGNTWVRQYNLTDHLGNTRAVVENSGTVLQQTDYYPFGTAFAVSNTTKNKYLYGSKELQDEVIGGEQLSLYDFEARFMDTKIPRFTSIDPLAEKYYSISPYIYAANNPILFIDPTGRYIDISEQIKDGKTIYTITITGKLINESGNSYTAEQMQAYANTIAESTAAAFTGSEGDVSWVGIANISVASDSNPLSDTDHAIRIVDQATIGAIASQDTGETLKDIQGYAPYGEKVAYITSESMDLVPAVTGKYANTGLTEKKERALGALTAHELGHNANLLHVPRLDIRNPEAYDRKYNGNLMHVGGHPLGGLKLLKEQITHIYNSKNLINNGRQQIPLKR